MAEMVLYVPPDVPGAAPLVTKDVRYRTTGTQGNFTYSFVSTSFYPVGRKIVKGYAINADYVVARYRTKTGKRRTRRIVVNQQTNTYSMKVRALSDTQKVKLQGRRYDGAAGRVVTYKVSPSVTGVVTRPSFKPITLTPVVLSPRTSWGAGSMSWTSAVVVDSSMGGGGLVKTGDGTLVLDTGNNLNSISVGVLSGVSGATLTLSSASIRGTFPKFTGTGHVLVEGEEVFEGPFEFREGQVWLWIDDGWQALDFGDAEAVSFIVR